MSDAPITDAPVTDPAPADPIAAKLDAVRAALDPEVTADALRAGLDVVRDLYTQLARRAGHGGPAPTPAPRAPMFAPPPSPLRGISIDQGLDLVIAQLRARVGDAGAAAPLPLGGGA